MYAFNSAAIFSPGHPYIESTNVLSDHAFHHEIGVQYTVLRRSCCLLMLLTAFIAGVDVVVDHAGARYSTHSWCLCGCYCSTALVGATRTVGAQIGTKRTR